MPPKLKWTDVEDIAIELCEAHAGVDPTTVRFTDLRRMVEGLANFEAEPGHNVNEQILEAIQAAWIEEREDAGRADDDEGGYAPPTPFRPG